MAKTWQRSLFDATTLLTLLIVVCLGAIAPNAHAVQKEDPPAAINIGQTALTAQNAKDFDLAIKQWRSLLEQYPECSLVGLAHYNCGVSHVQINQFSDAIDHLKKALEILPADETQKISHAYLFLGFSQFSVGKELANSADSDDKKAEAGKWLTTSTQTLEQLLKRFPKYEDADQAVYFQGEAFEMLGRLPEALASYKKMQSFENQTFRFAGLFALANVHEQLGQYDEALKQYNKYRETAGKDGGLESLNEVNFRTASTHFQLAGAAQNRGDQAGADSNYTAAEKLFGELADLGQKYASSDQARFRQALCANRLKAYERSAALFSKVASLKDSRYTNQALVYAGRDFMNAKLNSNATESLSAAIKNESEYQVEAAHWLVQLQLQAKKNEEAFKLATEFATKSATSAGGNPDPWHVWLLFDRADAASRITEKQKESSGLFLEIAEKFPNDELAPSALYNAAFAFLEAEDFENAIKTCDVFQEKYKTSDYIPDTLEIKGDACLLTEKPQTAESVFRRLAQDYAGHAKAPIWNLRIGLASYLQKNYKGTIEWLSTHSDHLPEKSQQAEALHWIGSSHFFLNDDAQAIAALQQSTNTDNQWQRADETLMTLARAQARSGDDAAAMKTTQELTRLYSKSSFVAEAFYRLGEMAYEKKDLEGAQKYYETVYKNHAKSEYTPYSLYSTAWCSVDQKKYDEAINHFSKVVDDFPKHELAARSLVGRGASKRQNGDANGALVDITAFLETKPEGQAEIDGLLELGLSQIDLKAWPDSEKTFVSLIEKGADSEKADRYYYELAWSQNYQNKSAEALKNFGLLAEKHPKSTLAPEANFHVGNAAFDAQKYAEAETAYFKVMQTSVNDALLEKATHQLAWCNYKKKNFEKSLELFKRQVAQHPKGTLIADGQSMISESLFELKKYDQAVEFYRVAKPAIEKSTTIKPAFRLTLFLHGSQNANKAGQYNDAIDFAKSIIDSETASTSFKHDAYLEMGSAQKGLGNLEKAFENWQLASADIGKTGARARCMIGDMLFEQRKFDEAIDQFKLVFYGFGGTKAAKDIRPWQAYAIYEAARCNYVRIKDAKEAAKPALIKNAHKLFNDLVTNYPEDQLSKKAAEPLAKLKVLLNQ